MSVNRVSFGKVVDIYYRYNKDDYEGIKRAERIFSNSRVEFDKDINIERRTLCDIRELNKKEKKGKEFFPYGNRIITGEDIIVYKSFSNEFGYNYANKYADQHSEIFIVDV